MCLPEGERDRERTMALEAVVYPQTQDPFGYSMKDFYNCNFLQPSGGGGGGGGGNWGYEEEDLNFIKEEDEAIVGSFSSLENQTENNSYSYVEDWNNTIITNSTPTSSILPPHFNELQETTTDPSSSASNTARPKRRRVRSRKNKEEIENQRMTHIAVERNRRKQMNEYLSVLRSLMPDSYVQRGDQASIVGGAINFVKELEQKVHLFGAKKEAEEGKSDSGGENKPFSEFFTFPQYSSNGEQVGEIQCGIADIEVTMVESHANLKIRSKKRPKQLLKMVSSLHSMRLTILHLNVTTTGEIVLYSISVKVEEDCKLGSVDDIAGAVYQILNRIQQETVLN